MIDEELWLLTCFGIFILIGGRLIAKKIREYLSNQQQNITKEFASSEHLFKVVNDELVRLQLLHQNIDDELAKIITNSQEATTNLIAIKQNKLDNLLMHRQRQFQQRVNTELSKIKYGLQLRLRIQLAERLTTRFTNDSN